jgi:hypothetical protein
MYMGIIAFAGDQRSPVEHEEENQQLRDLHAEIPGTLCNNFQHAQDNGEEINMHSRASGIMLHGLPYAQTSLQGKPKWEGKKFAVLENVLLASQWLWEKGLSFDLRERGKQLKLVLFMLVAVIIVLLQVLLQGCTISINLIQEYWSIKVVSHASGIC